MRVRRVKIYRSMIPMWFIMSSNTIVSNLNIKIMESESVNIIIFILVN